MTDEWFEKQQKKIEVMLDKTERYPSWINKTLLECMMLDYEAKQRLKFQDEQRGEVPSEDF